MSTQEVPQGTIADVLDWVGNDPQRAQQALDAEHAGQQRSTLISQLEAIEGGSMSDEPATVEEEELELAPGPEQPVEITLDAADAGTVIGPVHVRDPEVEFEDVLTPEEGDDVDTLPIEGGQVESLQAAHGTNGLALAINGEVFIFTDQMTATLKGIVDRAIIGLAL